MEQVVNFMPRPLYLRGKSPLYLLDRRLGGPQRRPGYCGIEKNLLPLARIEPRPSSPSLYWLSCLHHDEKCVQDFIRKTSRYLYWENNIKMYRQYYEFTSHGRYDTVKWWQLRRSVTSLQRWVTVMTQVTQLNYWYLYEVERGLELSGGLLWAW
jgi:hypothetical protein